MRSRRSSGPGSRSRRRTSPTVCHAPGTRRRFCEGGTPADGRTRPLGGELRRATRLQRAGVWPCTCLWRGRPPTVPLGFPELPPDDLLRRALRPWEHILALSVNEEADGTLLEMILFGAIYYRLDLFDAECPDDEPRVAGLLAPAAAGVVEGATRPAARPPRLARPARRRYWRLRPASSSSQRITSAAARRRESHCQASRGKRRASFPPGETTSSPVAQDQWVEKPRNGQWRSAGAYLHSTASSRSAAGFAQTARGRVADRDGRHAELRPWFGRCLPSAPFHGCPSLRCLAVSRSEQFEVHAHTLG